MRIVKRGERMGWRIAIYLRLSREDGDKDESDSIQSQRSIITKFALSKIEDGRIVGEYVDDGFTGTNFKRPNFQRMIQDIEGGEVNCVIVKDLSRFGRDYIGVGEYLEHYFPTREVRFIAVNDGYDTMTITGNDEFIMPIKNIFNAQYSKDISRKVKSSFRTMQTDGKFIGAFTSYGYKKDETDRHRLVIDESAAEVVRQIYDLFLSGIGKIAIAKRLNDRNIPCPSEYKRLNGLNYTNGQRMDLTKYWTYSTIHNILKNEMYIGNMVQNKSVRRTIHGKAKRNKRENWLIVKDTHEAIITKDKWDLVQELLQKKTRQIDLDSNVGIFAGYIVCGDCGRAMSKLTYRYKENVRTIYVCGSYKRYGVHICRRHAVDAELLERKVLDKLNEEIAKAEDLSLQIAEKKKEIVDLHAYKISLERILNRKKDLYEDYKNGLLTQEEYLQYKEDYTREEAMIKGQMDAVSDGPKEDKETNEWIRKLLKYKSIDRLDREIVAEILDKITVYETEDEIRVEIRLRIELT